MRHGTLKLWVVAGKKYYVPHEEDMHIKELSKIPRSCIAITKYYVLHHLLTEEHKKAAVMG